MPRGRFLSKGISLDEKVNSLSSDTTRLLFTWLIAHLDCEGRLHGDAITVKSIVFPRRSIQPRKVEKCLVELEKKGLIIRYSCNGNTYLVAPHFEKHQVGLQKSKEAQSQIPAPTPELLQSYSSISPPKAKAKAKAKDKDILAQKSDTVDKFDPFWIAYPKKKSKGDAEKTFKKINPDDQLLQIILKAIEVAKKSNDWQKDEGQYIPYPATWLNAKGWEDEILPGGNFGKHQGNTRAPKKPGEYSRPED